MMPAQESTIRIPAPGVVLDGDLVIPEGRVPSLLHPFKGNMDLAKLRAFIEKYGRENIPFGMITVTNNAGGGQPVSLANIRAAAAMAHRHGKPFIIDGCRFAENAWFIKQREAGFEDRTVADILLEICSYSDGATVSSKKGAIAI